VKNKGNRQTFNQILADTRKNPQIVSRMHAPVSLSFKYFRPGGEFCLSQSVRKEITEVMDCFRQATVLGWQTVLQSGGKGAQKAGLGCTHYQDSELQHVKRPADLSPDINIYGLRATQGYRVFAGYHEHVLYVLWFDRNHKIVPSG
jgi:hypothetical protein